MRNYRKNGTSTPLTFQSYDVAVLVRQLALHVLGARADEICGLKGMEAGVMEAFRDVCRQHGADWDKLLPQLREKSRYHVETY